MVTVVIAVATEAVRVPLHYNSIKCKHVENFVVPSFGVLGSPFVYIGPMQRVYFIVYLFFLIYFVMKGEAKFQSVLNSERLPSCTTMSQLSASLILIFDRLRIFFFSLWCRVDLVNWLGYGGRNAPQSGTKFCFISHITIHSAREFSIFIIISRGRSEREAKGKERKTAKTKHTWLSRKLTKSRQNKLQRWIFFGNTE